ncbi:hypothetical protein Bbelb_026470 [Branchiostoma belcheri]|nr:hypothetical protein Bbelb_026470 [Branchiostoma belcheri]
MALQEFLSANRQQRVVINGVASSWGFPTAGVPQGSILGLLLFVLYLNDIKYAPCKSSINCFVDDTSLYNSGRTAVEVANTTNTDLNLVTTWFQDWALQLHPDKYAVKYNSISDYGTTHTCTCPTAEQPRTRTASFRIKRAPGSGIVFQWRQFRQKCRIHRLSACHHQMYCRLGDRRNNILTPRLRLGWFQLNSNLVKFNFTSRSCSRGATSETALSICTGTHGTDVRRLTPLSTNILLNSYPGSREGAGRGQGAYVTASSRRIFLAGARGDFKFELKSICHPRGANSRPVAVGNPASLRPGPV